MKLPAEALTSHPLASRYRAIREHSGWLVEPLSAEDAGAQSMPDASPAKWHLAHTTWFFETVVLAALDPTYRSAFPGYRTLFNSYYQAVGPQFARPQRGLITRPTLAAVLAYRAFIDERLLRALAGDLPAAVAELMELGLQHEQQHQELLLMDLKHLFACNPLGPVYRESPAPAPASAEPWRWVAQAGGVVPIGTSTGAFAFDNERPQHRHFLGDFALANRLVTHAEFAQFVREGGYRTPALWLSDGWSTLTREGWQHPAYWRDASGEEEFTLGGWRPCVAAAPVCHLSYYEADAYARWAGARLPTEFEWEHAAAAQAPSALAAARWAPVPAAPATGALQQLHGEVWQWTASAYTPYPGFAPLAGIVSEYNGKFMANQMVLRGSCCVTPAGHARPTYRNFFYPHQRWQFSGLRLARDA
ncbi:MAG: ergothioneine biosynthesis protein EgtB [Gammaproteobacteria bacterium]|nr:ergothioneine biosynthesis protein EgtB [Gammaproteobacteria bacterium]